MKWKKQFVGIYLLIICILSGCKSDSLRILVVLPTNLESGFEQVKKEAEEWAGQKNVYIEVVAPQIPSAEQQQAVLEQALTQDWDAICIEPLGTPELAPILQHQQDAGVVVVTLRGSEMQAGNYNIEPYSPEVLGAAMMDALGTGMDSRGSYITMLPTAESTEYMLLEQEAVAHQKERYGAMLAAARLQQSGNSPKQAVALMKEAEEKYQASGVLFFTTAEGQGLAHENGQNGNPQTLVGLGDKNALAPAVEQGQITTLFYWSRANLTLTGLEIAYQAATGNPPPQGQVIQGQAAGYEVLQYCHGNTWQASDIQTLTQTEE